MIDFQISPGEALDRLTILAIKRRRIEDPTQLANINRQSETLKAAVDSGIDVGAFPTKLCLRLARVNDRLWVAMDVLSRGRRESDFMPRYARHVEEIVDGTIERARIKRQIDELLGSTILEEKQYG